MTIRFAHTQRGLGVIAALIVLILMAALAAAIVSLGTTQATTAAQDVLSAKAWQAARTGNEWALYKVRADIASANQDWAGAGTPCSSGARTATLNLAATTGFNVTVTCTPYTYNEGESTPGTPRVVRAYRISATACPSASCPDNTAATISNPNYVERTRVVIATE